MRKLLILSLITLLVISGCTAEQTSEEQESFNTPATIITMEDYKIQAYSFIDGEMEKINETTSEIIRPQSISWTESPEVQSFDKKFFYLHEIREGEQGGMIRPLEETQIIKYYPYKNTQEIIYKQDGSSMIERWRPTSEGIFVLLVPPVELYDSSERESRKDYAKLVIVDPENGEVEVINENILELDDDTREVDPYAYSYSEVFHPSKNIYSLIVDEHFSDGKNVTIVPYLFQYDIANGDFSIQEIELTGSPMTASLCHQGDSLFWQDYIPRNDEGELIEIYNTYKTNLATGETKLLSGFDENMGIDILFCKNDFIVAEFEPNNSTGRGTIYLIKNGEILATFTGILLNANDNYIIYDSTNDLNNIEKIMIYNVETGESTPISLEVLTRKVYLSN